MAAKRIVVVFGSTGGQGGSVIKSLLQDPKTASQFAIRAIVRDANKPAAQSLAAQGAEIVKGDLNDKKTVLSAFKDAYAAFVVTNYWEKLDPNLEIQQGKNAADAAKETGLQHLIFSSLVNVKELSKGVLSHVDHFDSKAAVEAYIRSIGIPASFFQPGYYMSNLSNGALRKNPDTGKYVYALPIPIDSPIPLLDTKNDTGKYVKAILLNREKTLSKTILGATAYYTPEQIVREFAEVKPEAGKGAQALEIPHEAFKGALKAAGLPDFVQEELLQNMRLMPEYGYYGGESLDWSHSILDEPVTTWKQFIGQDKAFVELK